MDTIKLSSLNKTWIFDLDGTLVCHNGYKSGEDTLLPGVKEFFLNNILDQDYVLIITARENKFKGIAEKCLSENQIYYNKIIYDMPNGERILINDIKPSGLKTAYSCNVKRNVGFFDLTF
jgi:hypothetical protein